MSPALLAAARPDSLPGGGQGLDLALERGLVEEVQGRVEAEAYVAGVQVWREGWRGCGWGVWSSGMQLWRVKRLGWVCVAERSMECRTRWAVVWGGTGQGGGTGAVLACSSG